jgi:membrane fusion protein (multidrug efflux system)
MGMADDVELVRLVMRMVYLSAARKYGSVVVLLALAPWFSGCDSHPPAQAATVRSQPQPAAVLTPSTPPATPAPAADPAVLHEADAAQFRTSGPLVAEHQADVAAQNDGRVTNVAVEIGDRVMRGQLLASLDDRSLRAAVDSQTSRLASLRAQVQEWEAEEKMDEADLRRADQLRSDKILSEEAWEHVKYKLDEVVAEVTRYRADKTAVESDLRAAKLQLEQCQIVAPFAGVVGRQSLRVTQEVKKGDVLFWITAEAPLRILFTVPESAMAAFPLGAPLRLTTLDYPELSQSARILRVSPVVDPASDSIQVIGAIAHPSPLLKPGMSMQVALASATSEAKEKTALQDRSGK